uniref:Secreted protein n=1 Tax=Lygus hesperus TaxID=30085 RepID=A0A146KXJ8_LYGHE
MTVLCVDIPTLVLIVHADCAIKRPCVQLEIFTIESTTGNCITVVPQPMGHRPTPTIPHQRHLVTSHSRYIPSIVRYIDTKYLVVVPCTPITVAYHTSLLRLHVVFQHDPVLATSYCDGTIPG